MKLFNFAIASIVDANTGSGITRQFVEQSGSNQSAYEQAGREIRVKSVLDLLAKIKGVFTQYISDSRAAARARRNTEAVSQLSEHTLKDIGLSFVDIQDLRSGQVTLEALSARRNRYRDQATSKKRLHQLSTRVSKRVTDIDSANQEHFETAKCA